MKLTRPDLDATDLAHAIDDVLQMGSIASVHSVAGDAFNSEVEFLSVSYRRKTNANAPEKLVLKRNTDHDGAAEFRFYSIARTLSVRLGMIPTCYFAEYDEASGASSLLLQDVSDTHRQAVDRSLNLEGKAQIEQPAWGSILKALAAFHSWMNPIMTPCHSAAARIARLRRETGPRRLRHVTQVP